MRVPLLSSRRRSAASANGRGAAAPSAAEPPAPPTGPLSAAEREVLDWFVDFTALLGVPASVGQIFGLLYLAGVPLPFENFVERLGISKGSASQGLHFLRGLGAVSVLTVSGDRREFYQAETSPTRLVAGFLEGKVMPRLEASSARLDRLERALTAAEGESASGTLTERVRRLRDWNRRARQFLPVVVTLTQFRS